MYLIYNPQVNKVIKKFVSKEAINKDDVSFKTIPEESQNFMEQFLNRFYRSFETLFKDKNVASEIFIERLMRIDAIRIDDKNKDFMPLKIAFDEMKDSHGNLEGGIFVPSKTHGVMLLDMDFMNKSKEEGLHTLIHELIHAMSTIEISEDKVQIYKSGISRNGRAFNRLNEGIVELIAQMMWKKMYSHKPCPGIGRYGSEVKAAEMVINQFESLEQFVEDYLVNTVVLEAQMKSISDSKGKSLFDFIKSFNDKDLENINVQKKFIREINNFQVNNSLEK